MPMLNFMLKAFSYQDLRMSPGAWSDKNTPGQIGLLKSRKLVDSTSTLKYVQTNPRD